MSATCITVLNTKVQPAHDKYITKITWPTLGFAVKLQTSRARPAAQAAFGCG